MLERFSAQVRHILILILGVVSVSGTNVVLEVDPKLSTAIGTFLTALVLYITPLTRQYGVGSDK